MDNRELASDGRWIYPSRSAVAYTYDATGNLITQAVAQYGATYVKTFTWTSGRLTAESLWVAQ